MVPAEHLQTSSCQPQGASSFSFISHLVKFAKQLIRKKKKKKKNLQKNKERLKGQKINK
jgi:hypothetical protein